MSSSRVRILFLTDTSSAEVGHRKSAASDRAFQAPGDREQTFGAAPPLKSVGNGRRLSGFRPDPPQHSSRLFAAVAGCADVVHLHRFGQGLLYAHARASDEYGSGTHLRPAVEMLSARRGQAHERAGDAAAGQAKQHLAAASGRSAPIAMRRPGRFLPDPLSPTIASVCRGGSGQVGRSGRRIRLRVCAKPPGPLCVGLGYIAQFKITSSGAART